MNAALSAETPIPSQPVRRYNPDVSEDIFAEMKGYIGFTDEDAVTLRDLFPLVEPELPRVADRFYEAIMRHPGAAAVFTGTEQIRRLHYQLAEWLRTIFGGNYDSAYCRQRFEIGRVHVRVGLAQHYMFAAMELIWQELSRAILKSGRPDAFAKLQSLHKLLTLEIGIMLQTYKESYSEQVREIERAALHERLTRAEHLAQVGQLAASLAHEIKNPLAGISAAIEVMRDGLQQEDARQPVLAEVLRQIRRLDGTVEDLLIYARPQQPVLRECDVAELIMAVVSTLAGEPRLADVRLERTIDRLGLLVRADPDQLEQVLINLVFNAAHASPAGGAIRIHAGRDSRGVFIAVQDFGQGMTDAVRQRALEPFFTTKSQGTGLGLAICKQIMSAHEGDIQLKSAPGEGTTVTIYIPDNLRAVA